MPGTICLLLSFSAKEEHASIGADRFYCAGEDMFEEGFGFGVDGQGDAQIPLKREEFLHPPDLEFQCFECSVRIYLLPSPIV